MFDNNELKYYPAMSKETAKTKDQDLTKIINDEAQKVLNNFIGYPLTASAIASLENEVMKVVQKYKYYGVIDNYKVTFNKETMSCDLLIYPLKAIEYNYVVNLPPYEGKPTQIKSEPFVDFGPITNNADVYGFGLLSKDEAVKAAQNVSINPYGSWSGEKSLVGYDPNALDRTNGLPQPDNENQILYNNIKAIDLTKFSDIQPLTGPPETIYTLAKNPSVKELDVIVEVIESKEYEEIDVTPTIFNARDW